MYFSKVTDWCRRHVIFSKAVPFISGLVLVHGLVDYGLLAYLITRLTDDGRMILPMAAQIVNVQEGISSILIIFVSQLSESFFGCFKVIVFTTITFILGLAILQYEARHQSVGMLIGAVGLLVLGKAGRDVPLKAFLADQLGRRQEEEDEQLIVEKSRIIWWKFSWILGVIGAIVLLYHPDVKWLSMISYIVAMVFGLFWFLLGYRYYVYKELTPSPLCHVTKIVKAAISKRHLDYPVSPHQLFQNDTNDTQILPHVAFLRWLDKAATLEPPCPRLTKEQEIVLFEVAKVREVKNLLKMLPMWLTFIVFSLVEATGSTFFLKQAAEINDKGFAIVYLVIIKNFTSSSISIIYPLLYKNAKLHRRRYLLLNRICIGMLCSVFCCLTAWRVEAYRVSHIKKKISVLWLIPQFFFLGFMHGFAASGLEHFFESQVCDSMNRYGPEFNEIARGLGNFVSVICILIFRSWFEQDNKNTSRRRLDKYYAMLSVLACLNFWICCLVSYWYWNQPHDAGTLDNIDQELQVTIEFNL